MHEKGEDVRARLHRHAQLRVLPRGAARRGAHAGIRLLSELRQNFFSLALLGRQEARISFLQTRTEAIVLSRLASCISPRAGLEWRCATRARTNPASEPTCSAASTRSSRAPACGRTRGSTSARPARVRSPQAA